MSRYRIVFLPLIALALALSGCAESKLPDDSAEPSAQFTKPLVQDAPPPAPPSPAPPPVAPPPPPLDPWLEKTITVPKGTNFARILADNGLNYNEAIGLVNSARDIHDLDKIKANEQFTIRVRPTDGSFHSLLYPLDRHGEGTLLVERVEHPDGPSFAATRLVRKTHSTLVTKGGPVQGTLWGTAEALGLSPDNIVALASIFEWEIDFNTQVRANDSFRMVIEDVKDAETGEHIRYGHVHAAEYINSGNRYRGYRFSDSTGQISYFNEDGMSARKMFLKSPLKFSRISSGFSKRRFHPVLKRWRSHNGIDYAASRGTPVRAIGSGKIKFTGKKGGYGKHVRIRHDDKYGSSYSHLSRIAVRRGQNVSQGTIIGYVGSTGLATGPHLHFEFYIHGKYSNFLAQKFSHTEPITKKERAAFKKQRAALQPLLDGSKPTVATASRKTVASTPSTGGDRQVLR